MNRKKYSVILFFIPLCVFLSSCSNQETDNSTINVELSNKTTQVTETDLMTTIVSVTEKTASNVCDTADTAVSTFIPETTAVSPVPFSSETNVTKTITHISEPVQSIQTSATSLISQDETMLVSSVTSSVQSDQTEEITGFDKVGGKWCFNGKEGTAYILIYENGGWIQFDEHDNETASGTLETENGNEYSMFTSDKQQYSDFTLKEEDYFKTSDGKDYYREYKNTND